MVLVAVMSHSRGAPSPSATRLISAAPPPTCLSRLSAFAYYCLPLPLLERNLAKSTGESNDEMDISPSICKCLGIATEAVFVGIPDAVSLPHIEQRY